MLCSPRKDLGLLALRLCAGGVFMAHGSQKLFGWFGGNGLRGTGEWMASQGFRPGLPSAVAAGAGEAGGGLLLALGLATPVGGAAAAGAMAGAVTVNRPAGFFNVKGGFEYPAFLGAVATGLALTGPGCYSLDHVARHRLNQPRTVVLALTACAAAAAVVVGRRERHVAAAAAADAEVPTEAPDEQD